MELALKDQYRPKWTERIEKEWTSNLIKNRAGVDPVRIEGTRLLMRELIEDWECSAPSEIENSFSRTSPTDRHVLAAAVQGGCDLLVTANLDDFDPDEAATHGIRIIHPDLFLFEIFSTSDKLLEEVIDSIFSYLENPRPTPQEYCATLMKVNLEQTTELVRKYFGV
jgi:hypothetical protein